MFVGGLHRSGTTPLARTLAEHPSISGLADTGVAEDEGQHLQDVYPRIRAYGGMGRFAEAPAAHLVETSLLVNDDNRRRLEAAWSPYWDLTRPLLLEKSPANLIMGRFLGAMFRGSALIVVVRHPVVVALAMQKWNPVLFARNGRRRVSLPGLVEHWVKAHQLLLDDLPSLERVHVLRYEDLVESPTGHLSRSRSFSGSTSPSTGAGFAPTGVASTPRSGTRCAQLPRGPAGRGASSRSAGALRWSASATTSPISSRRSRRRSGAPHPATRDGSVVAVAAQKSATKQPRSWPACTWNVHAPGAVRDTFTG